MLVSNAANSVPVKSLLPWQKTDISVGLRSPLEPGIYESKWRMSTASGVFFGDTIWVIITVEPTGTLALTQQLNKFTVQQGPTLPQSSPPVPDADTSAAASVTAATPEGNIFAAAAAASRAAEDRVPHPDHDMMS